MRLMISAAALGAALAGTAAYAAGPVVVDPDPAITPVTPVAPVSFGRDWTGGYVGAQLGYADLGGDEIDGTSLDGDGGLLGIHAGYNWDLGGYVVGVEGDWDSASFDVPLSNNLDADGAGAIDSIARLKFRAGADLGRTLPYVTAGVAQANADGFGALLDTDTAGWVAGVGVSHQITDQWVVGGEILYHRFDDFVTDTNTGDTANLDATTATLRASFRF